MNATLGLRVHSGWAVLVAITGTRGVDEVLERTRVTIIDPGTIGAKQPYHFAESMQLADAESHIADCAITSHQLAVKALGDVDARLRQRGYNVIGAAILGKAGRPLPPLPTILAAHPLIHTAEGEFFRAAFRSALERLSITVTIIPERELEARARTAFGKSAARLLDKIDGLGRKLGPPWTQNHKTAALAAALVLAERTSRAQAASSSQ